MPQVITNGLLTTYLRKGKGKPILLIHGWGDSASGLQNIFNSLSAKYDVIALDLPGFGGSEVPNNQPWNLDSYANFINHYLEKIGVTYLYAIVGHSNGGSIAIRAVSQGILSTDKLVLLASAGIRERSKKLGAKKLLFGTGKSISKLLPKKTQQKIRKKVYEKSGSDIFVAPQLELTFREIVSQDVSLDAKNIHIPTLLIYGQQDMATPIEYGKLFKQNIAGSELIIVENAGHFVHIDKPNKVISYIDKFLENNE